MVFDPYLRRRHENLRDESCRRYAGKGLAANRVAVFALFQPKGISRSTIETCRHLASEGYAVIAVSNAPLIDADRNCLLAEVWTLIERPNFGYDFGAYREGLRHVWDMSLLVEAVVLLNDSVWFPVVEGDDTLTRLEAVDWDISGIFMGRHHSGSFLESYVYRISQRVLEHPAYRAEWLGMPLSSNRLLTIRRGERGHSQRLAASGFSLGALQSNDFLLERLRGQGDDVLLQTLRFVAVPGAEADAERNRILRETDISEGWRTEVNSYFAKLLEKRNFYNSLPYAAATLMKYPFLKKGRDLPSVLWRRQWLAAVREGHLHPAHDWLVKEVEQLTPVEGTHGRVVSSTRSKQKRSV